MTGLTLIGAGKFALEITRYVEDAFAARGGLRVERYLSVPGEQVQVPAGRCAELDTCDLPAGTPVVLAVADPATRREIIDRHIVGRGLLAENVVHPSSRVDPAQLTGPGNVIGPHCYLGVNVSLGGFNVINYHCTVGNHSHLGSNNFLSPNFHCGNSVAVGDDNFFGLGCTLVPEVVIGSSSRFQAGITVFEDAPSGHTYLLPNRIKALPISPASR
ncbi:hypothetical protein KGA66_02435 [Actinocrinis puniceicyclus]|uniref:Acetyltransferase n=1 Tax=Actinocrinis puniceicyclus TaxID=977794 RepID=A0A8J7WLC0_9ACTN|nr:hypothetical protein [Actinocrinis puniceicyclus]MBS2961889.1 hypothetical protein [Actinocrinis puniceicyclus]